MAGIYAETNDGSTTISVIGTFQTLATITAAGKYYVTLDLDSLTDNQDLTIRCSVKVRSSSSSKVIYQETFSDAQGPELVVQVGPFHISHELVVEISQAVAPARTFEWSISRSGDSQDVAEPGDEMDLVANAVDTTSLADNAITAAKIAANAIGASEIATGAIDADAIGANAITAAKIATDAIDADALATDAVTEITDSIVAAGLDESLSDVRADIAANLVAIFSRAVPGDAMDLVANAVDAAAVATGAIDADAIASDSITAAKIAANAIGASELATDAIGADQVATSAVNEIVDQVWRETLADHSGVAGSTAEALDGAGGGGGGATAAEVWEYALKNVQGGGQAGTIVQDILSLVEKIRRMSRVTLEASGREDQQE